MDYILCSSIQSSDCNHQNPATSLETGDEFCVECSLQREGSSIEHALELHADIRSEQECEPAQTLIAEEPSSADWVSYPIAILGYNKLGEPNVRREFIEPIYDITNRLPGWLFLGQHIFPMFKQDELSEYLAIPSTDTICVICHLQVNRFVGCQQCLTPSQSLYNEISRVMHL